MRTAICALDWVEGCQVRLHEEGPRLSGVVIVRPRDGRELASRLAEAQRVAQDLHWRIDELVATFAEAIGEGGSGSSE
jgi:hypothetical protein